MKLAETSLIEQLQVTQQSHLHEVCVKTWLHALLISLHDSKVSPDACTAARFDCATANEAPGLLGSCAHSL